MHVYMLVVITLLFAITWVLVYSKVNREDFVTTQSRQCTVWRHPDKVSCDAGLFYRDLRALDYMSNLQFNTLNTEIRNLEEQIRNNDVIINSYQNMSEGAIADKINREGEVYISSEVRKGTNRDQLGIEQAQQRIANRFNLAKTYFNSIPKMRQDNNRFRSDIINKRNQLNTLTQNPEFKRRKSIYDAKRRDPNFRCKSEYTGWEELNSINDEYNDNPEKQAVDSIRGDPYNWAFCHNKNPNAQEKATREAHIKNKQYNNVYIDNSLSSDPLTTSIRFMTLANRAGDMMECDDRLVTPVKPTVPNGLLEISVNNEDIISSIRLVKYRPGDSRYIDEATSKSILDVDTNVLMNMLYDFIVSVESDRIRYYVYPKKSITYRVHYYYYDNKCQRFFGTTTMPLGPIKTGDMFDGTMQPFELGRVGGFMYSLQGGSQLRMNFPAREFVNPLGITSTNIQKMFDAMNARIQQLNGNIKTLNDNKNFYIMRRDSWYWNWIYQRRRGEFIWFWYTVVVPYSCWRRR